MGQPAHFHNEGRYLSRAIESAHFPAHARRGCDRDPRRIGVPATLRVLAGEARPPLSVVAVGDDGRGMSDSGAGNRFARARDTSIAMPVPRCAALRRDGRACGALASSPTASYCRHHERLAAELGEDAVRAGHYPRRRNPRVEAPVTVEETATSAITNGTITPAEVRPLLAQATAASLDEIQAVLLDAALGATREHWATFTCPDCGKKHRAEVQIPDVRARIDAIELLLREGLGRPAQAEEVASPKMPENAEAVERMSWHDLQHFAVLLCADEIESVLTQGGREALRQRLAEFDDGQRQVLSEALAEAAHA
jgi:hypothetical protein